MKKTKTGFTLIELLAVIVILGIILVIAGSNFMNIRKNANIEEAKKLEKSLTDLGPNIYSHEYISPDDDSNFTQKYENSTEIKITLKELADAGYIKSATISNPAGGGSCTGYLEVKKTNDGPEFKGNICCPNLYETDKANTPTGCSSFVPSSSDATLSK